MKILAALLVGTTLIAPGVLPASAGTASSTAPSPFRHVLILSIDGLHAIDLANWVHDNPASQLAALSAQGVTFTNAYAATPSNGFPGMLAIATGGTPGTTGVFYDDSYDRVLYPPQSGCAGNPGTEVDYTQFLDKSMANLAAGGTLGNPRSQLRAFRLPLQLSGLNCAPVFPHDFLRTNTVFEVIHAALPHARTAWIDDHPSYEILNGKSGTGVDDLYTPELNSTVPGQSIDYTGAYSAARTYDLNKVAALLNEIDGKSSTGGRAPSVPRLLGMNFKAVEVGQRLKESGPGDQAGLRGGYVTSYHELPGTPDNALALQLRFVDRQIGRIRAELLTHNLGRNTLVVVTAKYGDTPINRNSLLRIDPNMPVKGFPSIIDHYFPGQTNTYFASYGDVGLVWLNPQLRTTTIYHKLTYEIIESHSLGIHLQTVLTNDDLETNYNHLSPFTDSRTPDFIALPWPGVLYTRQNEIADHGGYGDDDLRVALLVSAPRLQPGVDSTAVWTGQIAPTILSALGLHPESLNSVQKEHTPVLPINLP